MRKIGVVILNYNNEKYTIECVKSVLNSLRKPDWIVIVDNKSDNKSLAALQSWLNLAQLNSVFLFKKNENRGYAAGNNEGINFLLNKGADAIWILNNDTMVDKAALGAMENKLFSKNRPGLCGSLITYGYYPYKVQCRGGGKFNRWTSLSKLNGNGLDKNTALNIDEDTVESELNFICGASIMASRNFLKEVGLFDEDFFLYREEQDLAIRGSDKFDLAYASKAHVTHFEGVSTGYSINGFNWSSFIILLKSHFRLILKHNPYSLPIAVSSLAVYAVKKTINKLIRHNV